MHRKKLDRASFKRHSQFVQQAAVGPNGTALLLTPQITPHDVASCVMFAQIFLKKICMLRLLNSAAWLRWREILLLVAFALRLCLLRGGFL